MQSAAKQTVAGIKIKKDLGSRTGKSSGLDQKSPGRLSRIAQGRPKTTTAGNSLGNPLNNSVFGSSGNRLCNYIMKELIESGTTSQVYKGVDARNNRTVAIKVISRKKYVGLEKKDARENRIYREVLVSFLLDHKHIVKLREFFFTDEFFYLVFDYVQGEQLLKKIIRHRTLNETEARKYFLDLLNAVEYCHTHNLVHRDIKIENVLIDDEDRAILIDFGLANFFEKESLLGTFCGSLYFAAPELLSGHPYEGPEIDVWSLGVVLYVMVCGKVPFDDKNTQSLYRKIITGKAETQGLSDDLGSLLQQMLDPNRAARIAVEEIFRHPWVGREYSAPSRKLVAIEPSVLRYIRCLFGQQFEKKTAYGSEVMASVYQLIKDRAHGRIFPNRAETIADFVSDRSIIVKLSLFRCILGPSRSLHGLMHALEDVLDRLLLIYDIALGDYICTMNGTVFYISIYRNRISRNYGIKIREKKEKPAQPSRKQVFKQIKKDILRNLNDCIIQKRKREEVFSRSSPSLSQSSIPSSSTRLD